MKFRLWPIVLIAFLVLILPYGDNVLADISTIQPSTKDVYVHEFSPDVNFNPFALVVVAYSYIETAPSGFYSVYGMVEYSLSSIPTGSIILGAEMGLYINTNWGNTDFKVQARRITSSWTENVVTWTTKPSTTTSSAITIDTGTADSGWLEWNITGIVDSWVNDATLNEGVLLRFISGGASTGEIRFSSRESAPAGQRPRLIVTYTLPEDIVPSYLVYLAGGITNITSEVGATGTEFNVRVENTGNVELTSIDLELYDHTPAIVAETDLFNIEIDEIRNHQFIRTHGLGEGSYSWQFQAHYQGDTEYWNFTLYVGPTGFLTQIFIVSTTLQPQQIDTDTTATISVSINNVGGTTVSFRIQVTSISLSISNPVQYLILQSGTGGTKDFLLFAQTDGIRFKVDVLVTPVNLTTGVAIGSSFFTRHYLTVTIASSVTTFSADDIGINDAILNGKINSLGGFGSATVYFTFWQTGAGVDNAFILPPNKQVVSFISDYRVWVGDLVPETQYSYEFRMEVGSSSNPVIYYGGIISFTTTVVFADPFTAARNGFAQALGIDSIAMGIILSTAFIVLTVIGVGFIVGERLEGMAQSLAIGISGLAVSSVFFSIGYLPLWILAFLAVLMAAIIIGLPTFQKGAPSE